MTDAPSPLRIVDGHVHVSSTLFIPEKFLEDTASNMKSRLAAYGQKVSPRFTEMVLHQHQDHDADELVASMDGAGIAKAVLLVPDFSMTMKCKLTPEEAAERHHRIRLRHPGRFFVLPGIDPRHGAGAVAAFERWIESYKFEGLKLYPPNGYSPSDRILDPFYEICSERGLPVLLHTGPTVQTLDFRFSQPGLVDEAARRFPRVNFILAHGGVSNVAECASLCAYRENVYIDVAGFTSALHPQGWQANLAGALRMGISHKIIFGTDWPINRMSGGLKKLVEDITSSPFILKDIVKREREMFFGNTVLRLLGQPSETSASAAAAGSHAAVES